MVGLACALAVSAAVMTPCRIAWAASETADASVADIAQSLVGAPYRWGGAAPDGFDCSGLVQYAFLRLGIAVPRTSAGQFHAAEPLGRKELEPGDVLFFRIGGKLSHVGLYIGDGRFVHAPSPGKTRVLAFQQALDAAEVDWHMSIHGGARHGFTNPDASKYGIDNIRYDADADRRSWSNMKRFLKETLGRKR